MDDATEPQDHADGLPHGQPRQRRIIVAAGLIVVLVIGGAGFFVLNDDSEDPNATTGSSTDREQAAYEFTNCVRDQGIDDYPDPTVESDGSIVFNDLDSLDATETERSAAEGACQHILDEAKPQGSGAPEERIAGDPEAAGWEEISPGGDCACADGSDFSFYARDSSPSKVALVLDGGGACWSADTCSPDGDNEYQTTADAPSNEGLFNADDERNPFADHSFVFVPYCTGDVHLGNAVTDYTADLTVQHKGYINGTAALDYLAETYPDATEVVVVGGSAGSVSAAHYAGLVADRFPDAQVTSIADSSGAYPDQAELNDVVTGDQWGAADSLADVAPGLQSIPGLYISAAERHPGITFARYDHAYDAEQSSKMSLVGAPANDLLSLIDANKTQIEKAGVDLHSYTAPGDQHVTFFDEEFYTDTVDGVPLVEWVADVVARKPVDDVHCNECERP